MQLDKAMNCRYGLRLFVGRIVFLMIGSALGNDMCESNVADTHGEEKMQSKHSVTEGWNNDGLTSIGDHLQKPFQRYQEWTDKVTPEVVVKELMVFEYQPQLKRVGVNENDMNLKPAVGTLVARFPRIDSHDSRESGDSRESEIRVIRANRPDAL